MIIWELKLNYKLNEFLKYTLFMFDRIGGTQGGTFFVK